MKTIKIMGKRIKIEKTDLLKSDGCLGDFDGDKKLIRIHKDLTGDDEREAILHESLHAILFYSGVAFAIKDDDLEEAVVRALEYNLPDVLKELNKKPRKKRCDS